MLNNEIWKPIKETTYFVSSKGEIKNNKGYILKQSLSNKGYYYVILNKNKKSIHKYVHRLIADAFIPNPNNYPCINHIDGHKTNNDISNLEWCTYSHNNKEAYRLKLKIGATINKLGYDNWKSKPINQYDLNGNFIKEWGNSREAQRQLGINASNIRSCCNGIRNKAGGYIWKYTKKVSLDEIE